MTVPEHTPSTEDPLAVLAARFGFSSFRPGQERVIESLLAGRSALAVFPTGAGKSLCYQLPALILEGVTVVVSPLIALMKDQIDFLQRSGIEAARLDSSLDAAEQREISERLRAGALKLLYVAPERFNNERFLAELARTRISLFAVDEAHCISEWGHNFRPDYLKLADRARELAAERVLALTATATPAVVADIRAGFGIDDADTVVTGFYRPNLTLLMTPVAAGDRDRLLLDRLRERPVGSTIVYVTLQRTALSVAKKLADAGLPARPYHAGMSTEDRVRVQEWWAGSPEGIVVATIAFGMGIDKADVRYVYHYNLPKGLESYSQETGRAGRDGEESICQLLACADDVPTLENFAFGDTPTREALAGLLADVLQHPVGAEFAVSEFEFSVRHDLRSLVLKTALTYLELDGVLRQGTPFYAGFRLRAIGASFEEIFGRFDEARAGFLRRLIESGKTGRTWTSLAPDEAATALGEERGRIVAALEYLDQQGLVELQAAELRQRFTVTARPAEGELLESLLERFARRERSEVERIQSVLSLVTHAGCQVRALVGYFGETRGERCEHCSQLPERIRAGASAACAEAADRDTRRRCGARGASVESSGSDWHAETTGPLPLRHHQSGDEPREVDARTAFRLARRPALRRRARLVRGERLVVVAHLSAPRKGGSNAAASDHDPPVGTRRPSCGHMRIEVGEPQLVPSLLGFLRGHVHLTAEQIGPREIEVSQLGSMNWDARRPELDLMLRVWRTSHSHAPATIRD